MELMIDHTYMMGLYKIPEVWGLEGFWDGEHMQVLGEWCTWTGHGPSAPFPHTLPYKSPLSSCSSVFLYHIF